MPIATIDVAIPGELLASSSSSSGALGRRRPEQRLDADSFLDAVAAGWLAQADSGRVRRACASGLGGKGGDDYRLVPLRRAGSCPQHTMTAAWIVDSLGPRPRRCRPASTTLEAIDIGWLLMDPASFMNTSPPPATGGPTASAASSLTGWSASSPRRAQHQLRAGPGRRGLPNTALSGHARPPEIRRSRNRSRARGTTNTRPHQCPVAQSTTTMTATQTASSSRTTNDDFRCHRSQFIIVPRYDQPASGLPSANTRCQERAHLARSDLVRKERSARARRRGCLHRWSCGRERLSPSGYEAALPRRRSSR